MTAEHDGALDILHVDMDCFFAAVEALDDPVLRGRAVVVGGTGPRGVVASCSYEARGAGIRSAMPIGEAKRRCPSAIFVSGRHSRYSEVSAQLHQVLREFTPLIEPISLDEAFLDVSGGHRLFGPSSEIGDAVRRRVREVLQLECSVGIGRSKLIAKLASREAKPRPSSGGPLDGPGVVTVLPGEELAFLHPRSVRDLWGVGPKTAERLARYGVRTIGELARLEPAMLERMVGKAAGGQLHDLSWGRDERPVQNGLDPKTVGHEETFPTDLRDHALLLPEVVRLSDSVGARLRRAGMTGRTVNLKLRFADFSTITRSHSLVGPLLSSVEIARVASALLDAVEVGSGIRLLGISVSALEPLDAAGGRQLSLLDLSQLSDPQQAAGSVNKHPSEPDRAEVEAAIAAIRARYGAGAVGPATVIDPGSERLRVKELGDAQWG
ncbi:MAG: DNA polymerase IV [Acidimicrobiales bacterium]